jgi:hypothetical protein
MIFWIHFHNGDEPFLSFLPTRKQKSPCKDSLFGSRNFRVGLHGEEILTLDILAIAPPTSPLSGGESSMLSKKMPKLCSSFFFFFPLYYI